MNIDVYRNRMNIDVYRGSMNIDVYRGSAQAATHAQLFSEALNIVTRMVWLLSDKQLSVAVGAVGGATREPQAHSAFFEAARRRAHELYSENGNSTGGVERPTPIHSPSTTPINSPSTTPINSLRAAALILNGLSKAQALDEKTGMYIHKYIDTHAHVHTHVHTPTPTPTHTHTNRVHYGT